MSETDKDQEPLAPQEDAPPVEEPAANPVENRFTEDDSAEDNVTGDGSETESKPTPRSGGNGAAWLALVIAIIALGGAGYSAWNDWQRAADTSAADDFSALERRIDAGSGRVEELGKTLDALGRREVATPAQLDTLRRSVEGQQALLDSMPGRLATLESSLAALAGISEGARDAWVLAEAEYYMQIANAQLQLASNPQLASLALKMADERIAQLANPALTDVRRAIADELAALDVMGRPDIEGATLMLSSLARVVDALPLAGAEDTAGEETAEAEEPSGARRAWSSVKHAMSGFVRVTPPDRARLVQLSPDAEFFLRSNVALQLQAARLALLRGEQAMFEQTLDDTSAILNDYFDADSAQVGAALQTLEDIRGSVVTVAAPDISTSLQLLRQYRTLQESAQ